MYNTDLLDIRWIKKKKFIYMQIQVIIVDHRTFLVWWSFYKYKCLWGVKGGCKSRGSNLQEHIYTLRLEYHFYLVLKKKKKKIIVGPKKEKMWSSLASRHVTESYTWLIDLYIYIYIYIYISNEMDNQDSLVLSQIGST